MKYKIMLTAEAREDLRKLPAHLRAKVIDSIEEHLSARPDAVSKSRIKKLRGYDSPAYRLRIDDIRVFYDVFYRMNADESLVEILAIYEKNTAMKWLAEYGKRSEENVASSAKNDEG